MILVAVGTQFPFDRLVRTVDEWAARAGGVEVIAQVGRSNYTPTALRAFPFVGPVEFRKLQERAKLFVAHAGMGSILGALEFGKPIIVMPRDHERGEHRNGHQMATARRFRNVPGVHVAMDEEELASKLAEFESMPAADPLPRSAPDDFTRTIARFIETGATGG